MNNKNIKADFLIEDEYEGDRLDILKDTEDYEDYSVNIINKMKCAGCRCSSNCNKCKTSQKSCH